MYKVIYSKNAIGDLKKLDKVFAKRIINKIFFFSKQKDIFEFSKPLKQFGKDRFRFRIGDYRVIFSVDKLGNVQILIILNVKHRRNVYEK